MLALKAIKQAGQEEKDKVAKANDWMYNYYSNDSLAMFSPKEETGDELLTKIITVLITDYGIAPTKAGKMAITHIEDMKKEYEMMLDAKTVVCTRFMNEWNGREYPRIKVSIQVRDKNFYSILNDGLADLRGKVRGLPFMYEGAPLYRISIKDDDIVINKAMSCLHAAGYNVARLEEMLADAPTTPVETSDTTVTLSKGNLVLQFPYDRDTLDVIKTIPKRKWNNEGKTWMIPMSSVAQAADILGKHKDSPIMDDLLRGIVAIPETETYLEEFAERLAISGASELSDEARTQEMTTRLAEVFPEGKQLYPFQYVGVRFAELSNGRCIIGDDMGIGKTIQALAYVALHPEHHPALVVCPANVKYNWLKEAQAWLPSFSVSVVDKGNSFIQNTDITIINYDIVSKQCRHLLNVGYKTVIFDECHALKNGKAARTKACKELAKDAESLLALSGTPIPNRPIELFNILNMINPSEWSFWDYAHTYCDAHQTHFGLDTTGVSNSQQLHERLRDVMIRRLKKEVLAELPDKLRQIVDINPHPNQLAEYMKVKNDWVSQYQSLRAQGRVPSGFLLNMLTDLRKLCGLIKAYAAVQWIDDYRTASDKPLIVFAHHKEVIQTIADGLVGKVPVVHRITGETPAQDRAEIVERFQNGSIDVLLCSTLAAKEGLTLTAADTVLFVEREWVPAYEEQAEDRVNRIGQEGDTVWATYLAVKNTVDDKFAALIESKRSTIASIVDGGTFAQRNEIVKDLLEAMIEAGDIPADMAQVWVQNSTSKGKVKDYA